MTKVLSALRSWRCWPIELKLMALGSVFLVVLIFDMFSGRAYPGESGGNVYAREASKNGELTFVQDFGPPLPRRPPYAIQPYPQQGRPIPRPRPDLDTEFLLSGGRPMRPGTCVYYNYAGQPVLRPCF